MGQNSATAAWINKWPVTTWVTVAGAASTIISGVTAIQLRSLSTTARVRWERWSPWTATSVRVGHEEAPGPKNRLNWPSRLGGLYWVNNSLLQKTWLLQKLQQILALLRPYVPEGIKRIRSSQVSQKRLRSRRITPDHRSFDKARIVWWRHSRH